MLNVHHRLVHKFRIARQSLCTPGVSVVSIRFLGNDGGAHGTRFSGPTASEVAALIVGDLTPECRRFDVIAETRSGSLKHISSLNCNLMALQYPILFPYGDKSYHRGIRYVHASGFPATCYANVQAEGCMDGEDSDDDVDCNPEDAGISRGQVTMLEYYKYYAHYREGEVNPYTSCGRLSQQIAVNAYFCVEADRLEYHFRKQHNLRSETYQGISDAMGEGNSTGKNVGVQFILHGSFTGGPRYMLLNYHDGMAICRQYGAPDLFITFTCNPRWQDIADALAAEPGQTTADRPDITTRVFSMKYEEFLDGVKDGTFFGAVQAYLYVVEFQKRGLPHTHTLVWLKADTKDPSPSFIDGLISAELPDPLVDPLGYALVDEFMVHGPCGVYNIKCACMKNNCCSKRFPKPLSEDTMVDHVGYPVYRRRDTGLYVLRQKDSLRLGNQWVVPYNMKLLKRFDAHINVEWCNKTNLLKYLFKYLTKGHDVVRMRFHVEDRPPGVFTVPCPIGRNEIDDYIKCRFVNIFTYIYVSY
ncbi:uncharacterized protein [Triticum aestivum]|uniref:uncharacterized protein isoform X1 n=1 Tax=Triticum aestivum TaxID=4565 RepID=UPI001D01C248|nr:uncharacterized protein LOC123103719 isoform X1 [Triticum aestivum]